MEFHVNLNTVQYHVNLGTKVPGGVTVELDPTNEKAVAYLVEYGIKQSLNDAIAAIKTTDTDYSPENTLARVLKRWDAILTGNVRSAGTREAYDPIGVRARKLARAAFMAKPDQQRKVAMTAFRQAGITGEDREVIAAIVARMAPAYRDAAEATIAAEQAATAGLTDGLDDILAGLTV